MRSDGCGEIARRVRCGPQLHPDEQETTRSIGFRIAKRTRKVDEATVERFRALPVANVSDCMARMTAGGARLRPMHAGGVMAGPALTVKTRPGDNLMVHRALDIADPGDVIVVDAGGDLTNAIIRELMLAIADDNQIGRESSRERERKRV